MNGKKPLKFGKIERKVSLNWASLSVSLLVAVLGWVSADLVPALNEYEGIVATISGIIAQIVPIAIIYLRNNEDIEVKGKDNGTK